MTFEELKAMDDTYVMHTYARFPVDIDHGQGATLYSLAGKSTSTSPAASGSIPWATATPLGSAPSPSKFKKLGHISNLLLLPARRQAGARTLRARTGMDGGVLWQLRGRGQRGDDQAGAREVLL